MDKVLSEFCGLLDNHKIIYERNEHDENMIRFRTKLPNHDITPFAILHFNPKTSGLSLSLSQFAVLSSTGPEFWQILNEFNADPNSFGCKMFLDRSGEIVILTNAILKGENTIGQIEDYLNIDLVALDKYIGRISELIDNTDKD